MPTPAIAVRCTCRGDAGSSGRGGGADDEVMDQGTKLADLVVVAARVHAVREHDDVHPALEVDPQGRAGEADVADAVRSEEHTSELQSQFHLVCRLLLEKKK